MPGPIHRSNELHVKGHTVHEYRKPAYFELTLVTVGDALAELVGQSVTTRDDALPGVITIE